MKCTYCKEETDNTMTMKDDSLLLHKRPICKLCEKAHNVLMNTRLPFVFLIDSNKEEGLPLDYRLEGKRVQIRELAEMVLERHNTTSRREGCGQTQNGRGANMNGNSEGSTMTDDGVHDLKFEDYWEKDKMAKDDFDYTCR